MFQANLKQGYAMTEKTAHHYLKAIYSLAGDEGRATTTALARRLGITPASVSCMLQKLADREPEWIQYRKSRGARLTEEGRKRALLALRHHRLTELLLYRTLGLPLERVHKEAECLESALSDSLVEDIARHLGHPERDPHGHPIPRRDGTLPEQPNTLLPELPPGSRAVVYSLSDEDANLLRYLEGAGILPGAEFEVVERGLFDGPVVIRIGNHKEPMALSLSVAATIRVIESQPREKKESTTEDTEHR